MEKRGQVTLFIIIAIIIIAVILIFIYSRQTVFLPTTQENLNAELNKFEKNMVECLDESSKDSLELIGRQGGYIIVPEGTYRLYNDTRISYLCYNIVNDDRCSNRMLLRETMQEQLSAAIQADINDCLEVQGSALKPYDVITSKSPEVSTKIDTENVIVTLDYPITLRSKRDNNQVTKQSFESIINNPLGKLYDISQEAVNSEAEFGGFDVLSYMLKEKGNVKIYPRKPYPDKIYIIKDEDTGYIFQFAIQGEPS